MIRCNRNCKKCKQLNVRTDDKGYPFAYDCMKYDDSVFLENFESTKEFKTEEDFLRWKAGFNWSDWRIMQKPIPKSIEGKIKKFCELQVKANKLDDEIRHWLYKNNYDGAIVDMLIDSGVSGDPYGLITFLNGEPNEYGQTIESFQNDNSLIDETDYGCW